MISDGSVLRALRRHPVLADAALASGMLVLDLLLAPYTDDPRTPVQAALTALTLGVLPLRGRLPVLTLALATAGAASVALTLGFETFSVFAPLLALYAVAVRSERRPTLLAWALTAAVLAPARALGSAPSERWEESLSVLPWTALVAAVGNGLRTRRAYLAALQERAVRAERSREDEAQRRVAQERLRIARELHDVVAHHIAVVGVQSGTAQHLLHDDPAAAATALGHVRRSAAAVLSELGDILTVLREPDEVSHADGSRAPAPGLARLDALLESFAAGGLKVDWSLHGRPRLLPATVDLIAYRVVEEALTNAMKHGTGSAHLDVDYGSTSLRLRVVNATPVPVAAGSNPSPAPGASSGTGHGLLGMRERATAVGGTISAGPGQGDSFCVQAELPSRRTPGSATGA